MDKENLLRNIDIQFNSLIAAFKRLNHLQNKLLNNVTNVAELAKTADLDVDTYHKTFIFLTKTLSQLFQVCDNFSLLIGGSPLDVIISEITRAVEQSPTADDPEAIPSTSSYTPEVATKDDKMLKIIQTFFKKYQDQETGSDSLQYLNQTFSNEGTETDTETTINSCDTVILSTKLHGVKTEEETGLDSQEFEQDPGTETQELDDQDLAELAELNGLDIGPYMQGDANNGPIEEERSEVNDFFENEGQGDGGDMIFHDTPEENLTTEEGDQSKSEDELVPEEIQKTERGTGTTDDHEQLAGAVCADKKPFLRDAKSNDELVELTEAVKTALAKKSIDTEQLGVISKRAKKCAESTREASTEYSEIDLVADTRDFPGTEHFYESNLMAYAHFSGAKRTPDYEYFQEDYQFAEAYQYADADLFAEADPFDESDAFSDGDPFAEARQFAEAHKLAEAENRAVTNIIPEERFEVKKPARAKKSPYPDLTLDYIDFNQRALQTNTKAGQRANVHSVPEDLCVAGPSRIVEDDEVFGDKNIVLDEDVLPHVGDIVTITHIDSPSEFYVQICDEKTAVLNQLNKYIRRVYGYTKNKNRNKLEAEENIGKYCVAYSIRFDMWFRAKIIDWLQEVVSDYVHVLEVDSGKNHYLSYKNLRNLRPDIAELPVMAIRCTLPYLYPPDSTFDKRSSEWPSNCLDAIYNMTGLYEEQPNSCDELIVTFVYRSERGKKVQLDLKNPNYIDPENEEATISQTMLELGLAVQIYDNGDFI